MENIGSCRRKSSTYSSKTNNTNNSCSFDPSSSSSFLQQQQQPSPTIWHAQSRSVTNNHHIPTNTATTDHSCKIPAYQLSLHSLMQRQFSNSSQEGGESTEEDPDADKDVVEMNLDSGAFCSSAASETTNTSLFTAASGAATTTSIAGALYSSTLSITTPASTSSVHENVDFYYDNNSSNAEPLYPAMLLSNNMTTGTGKNCKGYTPEFMERSTTDSAKTIIGVRNMDMVPFEEVEGKSKL